jgi:hypothetical protein
MNHVDFTSGCDHVRLCSDTLSAAAVESTQIRTFVGYDPLSDGRRFAGATCFRPPAQINDGLMIFISIFNFIATVVIPAIPPLRFQLTSWPYSVLSKDLSMHRDFVTDRGSLSLSEDQLTCSVS